MINEAVDRYHALLSDGLAEETDAGLKAGLKTRGLYFGERPICKVLRPHFYTLDDWKYLTHETEILLSAFARAHAACMVDSALRAQLDLEPYEEALFSLDTDIEVPWTTSRLDAFFMVEEHYLRFVEYNAETPAGIGYGDLLAEVFLELEVMKRFQHDYAIHAFPGLGHLLGALLHGHKMWGGNDTPQIAIVDWKEVPTLTEHQICRDYFERNGYRSTLADPRELEYRDGHLWKGEFRIDLIYKRVLCSELIRRMGIDNPIVQAIRDHAALMTNSFSAKLLAKKASLAFLSDEENVHLFNDQQRAVINAHIPWTRVVRERKTSYNGKEVDLLDFVSANRDRFVLKPNDEYGGKGVVLGWECSSEEWDATLREALIASFVVQERVRLVERDFPMLLDDGTMDISPRYVDADPYVFYGKTVGGCLTRLSSVSLLNVTAGGGSVVPMFVVERKA
jgi:uncharacterized circularly permuted ATP-grasp superfamily protein